MQFDWCRSGSHEDCAREYERFYFQGNKIIYTGEIRKCECNKRGCKCYVPTKERNKPKKRKRKS